MTALPAALQEQQRRIKEARMPGIMTSHDWFGSWRMWTAWSDRLGADTSPIGRGPTEADAIADLLWQLDERGF